MLIAHCRSLWERPHLQFYPAAWLAFGFFVNLRIGRLRIHRQGFEPLAHFLSCLFSLLIAVESILISSPCLTYVAGIGVVTSWLLFACRAGWLAHRKLTYSLLWINVTASSWL